MPSALRTERLGWCSAADGAVVLEGAELAVGADEVLVVRGRSGSGRSVLLDLCAGLLRPDQGAVYWDSTPVHLLGPRPLAEARRKLGYVFQTPALISNMTVYDNIALPLRAWGVPEEECAIRVQDCLVEHRLQQAARAFPEDLPAATLRHAALARALVVEPGLLLLDELTAGVDGDSEQELLDVLGAYRARRRVAIVMASNSERVWRQTGGRVVTLAGGRLHDHVPSGYH